MARTAEKKFQIAQRAYRDALEYGIPARELFFDTLALPISTGIEEDRVNGKETIESIRMIRENLPGCHIMLGVSNVSFGLNPAARVTLELGVSPRGHAGGVGWGHRQCRQDSAPGQN
jgi:5-methyltetrahydrofolate--homocysteine methyltransferase